MVLLDKDDLGFLKHFSVAAGNMRDDKLKDDKLKIMVEGNNATFSLLTWDKFLIKTIEVDNHNEDDFEIIVPIKEFISLLNSFGDQDVYLISSGFKVNKSEYSLSVKDIEISETGFYIDLLNNIEPKQIEIDNPSIIKMLSEFASNLSENVVYILNGCFIALDDKLSVYYKADLDKDIEDVYFNKDTTPLLASSDKITLNLFEKDNENYFYFTVDGVTVFVNLKEKTFINIFQDNMAYMYNHSKKVYLERSQLLTIMKRMRIITQSLSSQKVHITFKDGYMQIESRFYNKSKDYIYDVEYPSDFEGKTVILNSSHIEKLLNKIKSENIYMYADFEKGDDMRAVLITDDQGKLNFISSVFKDIERVE